MMIYDTRLQDGLPELIREKSVDSPLQEITCAEHAYQVCTKSLGMHTRTEEYVYIIAVNTAGMILGCFEAAHGTVSCAVVTPREIMMKLLLIGAVSFVLAHNHPSGSLEPSREDIRLTRRIREAGLLIGIELLDHIIVTANGYTKILDDAA